MADWYTNGGHPEPSENPQDKQIENNEPATGGFSAQDTDGGTQNGGVGDTTGYTGWTSSEGGQGFSSGGKTPDDPNPSYYAGTPSSGYTWQSGAGNGSPVGGYGQNTSGSASPYSSGDGGQSPSQQNPAGQNPVTPGASGGYRSQSGYDPYGWQQYQQPSSSYSPAPGGQPPKGPKKKKGPMAAIIASVGVLCAAAIVTLSVLLAMEVNGNSPSSGSGSSSGGGSSSSSGVNANAPTLQINDPDDTNGLTTREIVEKNINSSVVITMYQNQQSNNFGFGGSTPTEVGGASGIVMTADGYIITNAHCVINEDTNQPYDRIDVTMNDGTVFENAEIIGADTYTDLAVIKVSAANLVPAEFGDSTQLQLGDKVVAIGNAGGLQSSVSQGVVSGLNRDVYENSDYAIKCLQIDAAINPGNSGGPLLNGLGQVIGVNSAKIVKSGYENLGFAIPINEAKPIIDDLVKYGYVKGRVMLGITGSDVTQTGYEGFMIRSINDDSVLSGTKAQVGDIITKIDGVRVQNQKELRAELAKHSVGEQMTLTLLRVDSRTRQTSEFEITVTLTESKG